MIQAESRLTGHHEHAGHSQSRAHGAQAIRRCARECHEQPLEQDGCQWWRLHAEHQETGAHRQDTRKQHQQGQARAHRRQQLARLTERRQSSRQCLHRARPIEQLGAHSEFLCDFHQRQGCLLCQHQEQRP